MVAGNRTERHAFAPGFPPVFTRMEHRCYVVGSGCPQGLPLRLLFIALIQARQRRHGTILSLKPKPRYSISD